MAAGITVRPFLLSFPVIFAFSLICLNFLLLPIAFAVNHPLVVILMTLLWQGSPVVYPTYWQMGSILGTVSTEVSASPLVMKSRLGQQEFLDVIA